MFVVQAFSFYEERHRGRQDHWLDVALVALTAVASTATFALQASDLWRSFVIGCAAVVRRGLRSPAMAISPSCSVIARPTSASSISVRLPSATPASSRSETLINFVRGRSLPSADLPGLPVVLRLQSLARASRCCAGTLTAAQVNRHSVPIGVVLAIAVLFTLGAGWPCARP